METARTLEPFEFRDAVIIIRSTGEKAGSLRQLRGILEKVDAASIFHHTYQYFAKGHVQEYTNDLAQWAGEGLEEGALAEQLSNIDPYSFGSAEELRAELLRVIDSHLEHYPEPRDVLPGGEFFFNEALSFIFPIGVRARNLAEFLMAIKFVEPTSIYYHFYEARVRLPRGVDDFSTWFSRSLGADGLAQKVRAIDPFMHTFEGIRQHLIELIEQELRAEMEFIV